MNTKITIVVLLMGLFAVGVINTARAVDTDPAPPQTINELLFETFNASLYGDISIEAEAGNVTALTIFGVSQTIHWQGYYGNITATIVLEDAQGNTLYNWSAAEPQGEIYAARNTSITWDNVGCFVNAGTHTYELEEIEVDIEVVDADGINDTFNETNHPTFYLGSDSITGCPTSWTFVNDDAQQARFAQVLLEDDAAGIAIYTTLIENRDDGNATDVVGFDGGFHDFQLMVPENGTLGNDASTTYYFWVQLS